MKRGFWLATILAVVGTTFLAGEYWETVEEDPEGAYTGLGESPALQVIRRMGKGQGVTAAEGRYMHDLIVRRGYSRGLDIGTANGYSAIWFGMALNRSGGSVVTIEIDPATAGTARANFRAAGLEKVIDSRVNDAFREIPQLEGGFDFVFIDTGTRDNRRFLELLGPRISPGGAVMAHNAGSLRWFQRDYWKSVTDTSAWETTRFGSVAVSLKLR